MTDEAGRVASPLTEGLGAWVPVVERLPEPLDASAGPA